MSVRQEQWQGSPPTRQARTARVAVEARGPPWALAPMPEEGVVFMDIGRRDTRPTRLLANPERCLWGCLRLGHSVRSNPERAGRLRGLSEAVNEAGDHNQEAQEEEQGYIRRYGDADVVDPRNIGDDSGEVEVAFRNQEEPEERDEDRVKLRWPIGVEKQEQGQVDEQKLVVRRDGRQKQHDEDEDCDPSPEFLLDEHRIGQRTAAPTRAEEIR